MPWVELFDSAEAYYATCWHECVHWSGPRLGRELHKTGGDAQYAAEELVAELGSAFLMADVGLSAIPRRAHAQYLQHWLGALREQPQRLWGAASAAEKACALLRGDVVHTETTGREVEKARMSMVVDGATVANLAIAVLMWIAIAANARRR
jgi:antirestriction protein ArdC